MRIPFKLSACLPAALVVGALAACTVGDGSVIFASGGGGGVGPTISAGGAGGADVTTSSAAGGSLATSSASGGAGGEVGSGGATTGQGGATTTGQGGATTTATTATGSGGGMPECMTAAQCPATGTVCKSPVCDQGKCTTSAAAQATACTDGGGTLCDGAGTCLGWLPLSATNAPSARYLHTAVWSGTHMIIWGGDTAAGATNTGYKYSPTTDTWTAISMTNAPSARHSHQAIWTGTKMIVWGGYGGAFLANGGIYDPATDTWAAMATAMAPGARVAHAMHFTGTYVLVWGGRMNVTALNTGGRYHVANNQWSPMSTTGAPSPRFNTANAWLPGGGVLSNGAMFVWGGTNTFDWYQDGATYDPTLDKWATISTQGKLPPYSREGGSALAYTAAQAMMFGGWDGFDQYSNELHNWFGLNQAGGYWYLLQPVNTPAGRAAHVTLAPGPERIFVWGGCYGAGCANLHADGGVWKPDNMGGKWTPIPADSALTARQYPTAVWSGTQAILWGGFDGNKPLGNGARRAIAN